MYIHKMYLIDLFYELKSHSIVILFANIVLFSNIISNFAFGLSLLIPIAIVRSVFRGNKEEIACAEPSMKSLS